MCVAHSTGGRWPCHTCSLTRVGTPGPRAGVRVSTQAYPEGGAGGYPHSQKGVGAREWPGRGNTVGRDTRVSVLGGNTCARVGLRSDDPYSHHSSSSAMSFKRPGGSGIRCERGEYRLRSSSSARPPEAAWGGAQWGVKDPAVSPPQPRPLRPARGRLSQSRTLWDKTHPPVKLHTDYAGPRPQAIA